MSLRLSSHEFLLKGLEARPHDFDLRRRVVGELVSQDQIALAVGVLREAPGFNELPEARKMVAEILGRYPMEADEKVLRSLLESFPADGPLHLGLAKVLRRQGDAMGAEEHYRMATIFDPELENFAWEEGDAAAALPEVSGATEYPPEPAGGVMDDHEPTEFGQVVPVTPQPLTVTHGHQAESEPYSPAAVPAAMLVPSDVMLSEETYVAHATAVVTAERPVPPETFVTVPQGTVDFPDDHDIAVLLHQAQRHEDEKGKKVGAILLAIGLHALVLLLFALLMIHLPSPPPAEIYFVEAPKGKDEVLEQKKITVQTPDQKTPSSAVAQATPVLFSVSSAPVVVPNIPKVDNTEMVSLGVGDYGFGSVNLGGKGTGMGMSFFGTKSSGSTVLVIDVSASMVSGERDYEKIEREAMNVIKRLPLNASFNLVLFAKGAYPFQEGKMVSANKSSIEDAVKFLDNNGVNDNLKRGKPEVEWKKFRDGRHLGTNTAAALSSAFAMRPETIILLSDGYPTGKTDKEVFALVKELQGKGTRRIIINTISYKGDAKGAQFMKTLAQQNGGVYKQL